jgi:hypothetical protein
MIRIFHTVWDGKPPTIALDGDSRFCGSPRQQEEDRLEKPDGYAGEDGVVDSPTAGSGDLLLRLRVLVPDRLMEARRDLFERLRQPAGHKS